MRLRRWASIDDLAFRFGRRLRCLRRVADVAQEQFAERAGISPDQLGLIERGCGAPSFRNVAALPRALDAPIHESFLFHGPRRSGHPTSS